jgi:signal transduction histidine kinase
MRISTKIISGYGILIALMLGLLLAQAFIIRTIRSSIQILTDVDFESAQAAIKLGAEDIHWLTFRTNMAFITAGSRVGPVLEQIEGDRATFETDLGILEKKGRSAQEQQEIQRLARLWKDFSEELARQLEVRPPEGTGTPPVLEGLLGELSSQITAVKHAIDAGIKAEVSKVRKTANMALTAFYVFAAIALISSGLVSVFIVQSISAPLKQLTYGTRTLAEGKFFYRLDTTRHDEFAQLAKDFNTMTQRLNELDQMKKDFVSHVSHELKAPLASMQETIHLLLEQIPGPLTDKQRRLLELNLSSGQRLSAMIGNLLDLSRMEAGVMQYELKNSDLAGLAQTAAAELQPLAGERNLSLTIEAPEQPIMIECDGDRIMQIVKNLLGNAIKFSPKGKEIRVRVTKSATVPNGMPASWRRKVLSPADGKEFALVTVTDSGPGVPDQHKVKIFEKFHQVKQGKKVPGQGVGLGLAISQTIAEAHRGAIWVEDNPAGGSIFLLLLPPGGGSTQAGYRSSSPI